MGHKTCISRRRQRVINKISNKVKELQHIGSSFRTDLSRFASFVLPLSQCVSLPSHWKPGRWRSVTCLPSSLPLPYSPTTLHLHPPISHTNLLLQDQTRISRTFSLIKQLSQLQTLTLMCEFL